MDRASVTAQILRLYEESSFNRVRAEDAICPEVAGLALYDAPLIGVAPAQDALFEAYKKPEAIGPWFMKPEEWLPGAKTVISLFFPFTEAVRASNRGQKDGPSPAWLHGRIEGQVFLTEYIARLRDWLISEGVSACAPMIDPRFQAVHNGNKFHEYGCVNEKTFGSNWSERHAAYAAGLGTFSLSKGLITEKGMAGRFTSVITGLELPADARPYTGLYDYCIQCGACVRRCPAQAIDLASGKDHTLCRTYLLRMREIHEPRFGCGLCQTHVPCEKGIPGLAAKRR